MCVRTSLARAALSKAPTFKSTLFGRSFALLTLALAPLGAPIAVNAASLGASSAYGESVDLHLLPLLGAGIPITSGPLPTRSGSAPPAYDLTQQVASVVVSSPLLGTVLQTGIFKAHAASTLPGQDSATGNAEVNNLSLRLAGVLPLLTLTADTVVSNAAATGPCTGAPTATGGTTLTNVVLGGPLGVGIAVPVHPSPNFVLLNLQGIRVVLNEQIATGTGLARGLTVNAIHVTVTNSVLAGLGVLSGDVTIAQSHADLFCEAPPVTPDLALTAFATPDHAHIGDAAQIEFEVDNFGPGSASQVVFSGSIAGAATIESVVPSQGTCTGTMTLSCAFGTLPVGGFAAVTVHLRPTANGFIIGSGSVASSTPDPNPEDNQASASIEVRPSEGPPPASANLAASVTDSPDPVSANGSVTYVATLSNLGPDTAEGVLFSIDPPTRGTLSSVATNRGSCTGTSPILCSIGSLTLNQSAKVTVVVGAPASGTLTLTATATASTADADLSNNQASASTQVAGTPPQQQAHRCDLDDVPAATLLFPYFEVELGNPDGKTTIISIVNSVAAGHLARVTLWTDCGVPSMSFDVYLTGFDVQTINLRDLFNGKVPQTGLGLSPRGNLSDALSSPLGCPLEGTVAAGLNANEIAHVRAWHTGQRSPLTANCASLAHLGASRAVGYVTVDAVQRCSLLTPADPGYFGAGGVASNDNVLWGDYLIVDRSDNSAKGDLAVHIVAEPGVYKAGDYTFYARYVNGSGIDARRPLGTSYATRYLAGGVVASATDLLIWRDTKVSEKTGFACGSDPSWFPLEQRGVIAFDEEETAVQMTRSDTRMPVALQIVTMDSEDMPTPASFGWAFIDLWHKGGLFGDVAQGWVTTTMGAEGKYSIGQRAVRLDSACDKF